MIARILSIETLSQLFCLQPISLVHQNRTIAIASDFRVDGAKSPEIPQKEGVLGSAIAARNRKSLATFHRTLKSQCGIAFSCFGNRAISGVRDGHRNRKSQKIAAISVLPCQSLSLAASKHLATSSMWSFDVPRTDAMGLPIASHDIRALSRGGGGTKKDLSSVRSLVARAIRNAIRANRFARIIRD